MMAWPRGKSPVRLPFAVQKSGVDLDHRINVGHSDSPRKAVVKQTETDTLSVVEAAVTATVPSHFPHNTITIARCTVSSRAFASSIAATRFSRRCTLQCDLDGFEFDESAVDEDAAAHAPRRGVHHGASQSHLYRRYWNRQDPSRDCDRHARGA